MTKCPFCAEEILDEAKVCKHCGKDFAKEKTDNAANIGCFIVIGIILLAGALFVFNDNNGATKTPPIGTNAAGHSVTNESSLPKREPIELISLHSERDYDYAVAEGQVKNISDTNIDNLEAVVSWETKDGQYITSDSALVDFNPILPGQISPFKVLVKFNPAMKTARITFKELMGGTVPYKMSDKFKKE